MFYQSFNSLYSELLKIESGNNLNFPPHLHGSFEFITLIEGEMTVTVDKNQYDLQKGESLLVFPNQVHSLSTSEHSSHLLCIFSPKLVQAYGSVFLNKRPVDNKFSPDPFYISRFSKIADDKTSLGAKGLLYSLCSEFHKNAVYEERDKDKENLLLGIFDFVENNYNKSCSLGALAEHMSYHSVYLSKYFKKCTGISYTDYVNRYKVTEASYMLKNSDRKVLEVAYECGFESLRTFNRAFKAITGSTPGDFRASAERSR